DVRLDEVVLKALEKEPGRRYQTAVEMKSRVETVGAPPPGDQTHDSTRPRAMFWGNLAMAVVAGGILLTVVLWRSHFSATWGIFVLFISLVVGWIFSIVSWRTAKRNAGVWQASNPPSGDCGRTEKIRRFLTIWWVRQLKGLVWEIP